MRSVVNPACKPFMSVWLPFLRCSWRSSSETVCPIAAPSPVFWARLIRQAWRHYGPCFRRISWPEPRSALHLVGSGIARDSTGCWSMSMEPNRQHDSGPFRRHQSFLLLTVVLSRCAPKAISGANEDRWDEHGPRCYNRSPINGWAPLLVQATAITVKNCDTPCKLSRRMRRLVWKHGPAQGAPLEPVWGDWTQQGV